MITGKTQTDFTEDKEVKIKRQIGKKHALRFLNIMLKVFHQFKRFGLKYYPPKCIELFCS